MRSRPSIWILFGLLALAVAWLLWPRQPAEIIPAQKMIAAQRQSMVAPAFTVSRSLSTAPLLLGAGKIAANLPVTSAKTNQFAWRLSNTRRTIGQLVNDPRAILLANAFIDTGSPLNFSIPRNLQAQGDPGAYIVQAQGPIDGAFRALLASAGAQIVSYIPNNAYLVTLAAGSAAGLSGQPGVQSVLPYEPYYKISSSLLGLAVEPNASLPPNTVLTLGLFAAGAAQTVGQIQQLGGMVVGTDQSPFGPLVRVLPPQNWTALAGLPGVQIVEVAHRRELANDLARVTLGISVNTVTNANYRGLSGSNVVVEVNDTGIDATHPDFARTGSAGHPGSGPSRVIPDSALSMVDTNGHGTHVAGIIAGNGSESYTVISTPQGSVTNADFRGKAPLAQLYSVAALNNSGFVFINDSYLQMAAALTNALISNNSWDYDGDNSYDLAAASYDAAARDALPLVTGSQPVLFVFAAGNDGGGDTSGGGGDPDTIMSPGTAKNVITVGALEQYRNITNIVTGLNGSSNAEWQAETDTGYQVADYSSRGNVGIGTEGTYGRFKPDVVAPGSFVISTRSSQWDQNAYYNPTNGTTTVFPGLVYPGSLSDTNSASFFVYANASQVTIQVQPFVTNSSLPVMPIYVSQGSNALAFVGTNSVSLPAVPNGVGWSCAVSNITTTNVLYNLLVFVQTTNDMGNYYTVLSNLNYTLGPWYRYESGTSMSAPAVSGVLALMQDYFTNTLHLTPSPAVLKALLINGARSVGSYNFVVTNSINFQGWGLPNLPTTLPLGLTNQTGTGCSSFFLDQNPTNALATGSSQAYSVSVTSSAQSQPLRVTLAWTDPPGNPSVAIKLVNNLDLMVSNNVTGSVYFGNDVPAGSTFNEAWNTNGPPNLDYINNVENVFLPSAAGGSYTVTVIGRSVNVNAVTAQTNNVVQDYALVISSGNGGVNNALTVTPAAAPPVAGPQITYVTSTNTLLMNQLAGANTPLLGTNTVGAGPGYATNAVITLGMTNQWHFYVVTNTLGYTNAAFILFLPQTLAVPRMGVFADASQNPTQPTADLDLFVATEPGLTNLDPNVVSNCVNGYNGDGAAFDSSSGTEYVIYSNSTPNQTYYIGVKSETQEAANYDFLPEFSLQSFSQQNPDGSETVNGVPLPVNIPVGSPAVPGSAYVFALAVQPIQVQNVIVTDQITHQNLGDLIGTLTHSGAAVVLNNHDSLFTNTDVYNFVYDDSPTPSPGSQPSDGPGSLLNFQGQQAVGAWVLKEVDDSITQTGSVTGLTLLITPHVNLGNQGVQVAIEPQSWFYTYIDVPAGATNLTVSATNFPPLATPPLQLYVRFGANPTQTLYDKTVTLSGAPYPGGSISIGPSDSPPIQPGRYYVGIYNASSSFVSTTNVLLYASIGLGPVATQTFTSAGPTNLLDDAVTYSSIFVTNTATIASLNVGLCVQHPRISDLAITLISPDGTRYLLMENRGGTSTNGCGATLITTNLFNVVTNYSYLTLTDDTNLTTTPIKFAPTPLVPPNGVTSVSILSDFESAAAGTYFAPTNLDIWNVTSNQVSVVTDPATAQDGTNFLALANGTISNALTTVPGAPYTLTYYSRGPGIISWWRGENNANDSIGGNNGAWVNGPGYTNGEVQQAFNFDGSSSYISVPYAASLIPAGSFSIEGWIYPTRDANQAILSKWQDQNGDNRSYDFETISGRGLSFPISDMANQTNNAFQAFTVSGVLTMNAWNHVAATYDSVTGIRRLYVNGVKVASLAKPPISVYNSVTPVTIGVWDQGASFQDYFQGSIDELSLYNRTLSDSEIEAIFTNGSAGKFNPTVFSTSPSQSLAEASISVAGLSTNFFGNNTAWQQQTVTFTPTQTATPVVISGLEPGMLLDSFGTATSTTQQLYYQPEQDISGLDGTSAYGTWTLEILDDRVGATNNAALESWQLQFSYASTNASSTNTIQGTLLNGQPQTNAVGAGSISWYQVNVPTNALAATNTLLFATLPVNLWFSTNVPPTITNSPGDVDLIQNQTNGTSVLGTNGSVLNMTTAYIVPGGTYYLGVQNTNSVTVTNGLQVNFDLASSSTVTTNAIIRISSIVHTNISGTNGFLLTWFAPSNYVFQVQWTTLLSPATWLTFTNIITYNTNVITSPTNAQFNFFDDGSQTGGFGPTRFYRLIDLLATNTLTLPLQTNFTVASSATVTVTNTAMDSRTNAVLTYVLTNAPAGSGISSNGIITWTNATPAGLAARFDTIVTDDSVPPLTATNAFTIFVTPFPSIANVTGTATNTVLQWSAPTNDQFQVRWTTNLTPVITWTLFPNIITSPTGTFLFTDTNAPLLLKFYQLVLLP